VDLSRALSPGARVVVCDDPETVALELADGPGVDLVDDAADAASAIAFRRDAVHTGEDPERAALRRLLAGHDAEADRTLLANTAGIRDAIDRYATALGAFDQAATALRGRQPLSPEAADALAVDAPPGEIDRLAALRAEARRRYDEAHARLVAAAEPPAPPVLLAGLGGVHPAVVREIAQVATDAAEAAARIQAGLGPVVPACDPLDLAQAEHAGALAHAARVAAVRAQSRLLGALATATGLLLVIHAGRFDVAFDTVPLYLLAATVQYRNTAMAEARGAADRLRRRLARVGCATPAELEAREQQRRRWLAGCASLRAAEAALAAALDRWSALAGDADPSAVEELIAAAADAARLVAAAPARAAARAEAEAAMAAAEDDAGAAERALRNWAQRLGITADAIDDIPWAARERAAESDFARRSVAFRTAEREVDRATATLRALGFASAAAAAQALDEAAQRDGWRARVTELDAVPARTVVTDPRATRPLVVCAPVAAGQLAGISAPLAVVVVTNDNALAVAARATGVEVIDARRDASAPLAA